MGGDAASRCCAFGLAEGAAGAPVEGAMYLQQLLAVGTRSGTAFGSSPASVAAQHSFSFFFCLAIALACPLASSVTISRRAPVQLPLFFLLLLVQRGASRYCGIGQYFDSAHGICEDCPAGYECGLSASDNAGTLCSPVRVFSLFPASIFFLLNHNSPHLHSRTLIAAQEREFAAHWATGARSTAMSATAALLAHLLTPLEARCVQPALRNWVPIPVPRVASPASWLRAAA